MSGRPDNGSADLPELRQQVGADGVLASVVSSVNLTTGRGTISYVYPVSGLPVTGISQDSPAVLRAVDGSGAVLGEFPVQVKPYADLPGDERRGLIDVVLPVPAGTTSLALVIDGRVADTHSVGGTPPAVRAIRPAVTPDGQLRVEMEFDRELTGRLNYAVQVSADDGRTWLTAGVGLKDTTFTLDRSQFAAARVIRVRVITSAGTSASVVTSEPVRVGDRDADR
jgi:hypothetical protein